MDRQMVSNWVGNSGYAQTREDFMIDVLLDIALGVYSPEDLGRDIAEYSDYGGGVR